MSFVKAVGQQWNKSAFAEKIAQTLKLQTEVNSLFIGATSITTVSNLIAAMAYCELDSEYQQAQLTDAVMLTILFDCFRLLVVKQAEQNELSQAEHLIVQITDIYAAKDEIAQQSPELEQVQIQIRNLCLQLAQLQKQRRQQSRNMGR